MTGIEGAWSGADLHAAVNEASRVRFAPCALTRPAEAVKTGSVELARAAEKVARPAADDPFAGMACISTSFRAVGFEQLGQFVLPPGSWAELGQLRAHLGAAELVYLATCNRVEVYARFEVCPEPLALHRGVVEFFASLGRSVGPDTFDVHLGTRAVRHLHEVIVSLHSLALGETDIARQVRRAIDDAAAAGLAGPGLRRLFDRASKTSRQVRTETGLGQAQVSVASIALGKLQTYFGATGPGVSVLIGVGDMTRKVAQAIRSMTPTGELVFVNRTVSRAEELAAKFGGRALSLAEFRARPLARIDLVFTATSAPEPVVDRACLEPALEAHRAGGHSPLVICDMGVPRDVDPELDTTPGALVVHLGQLETLARHNQAARVEQGQRAAAAIAVEVARYAREEHFRRLADESARAMLGGRMAHLGDEDREQLRRFVVGLAEKIARQPLPEAASPPPAAS